MALDVRNTTSGVNPSDRTAETGNPQAFEDVLVAQQTAPQQTPASTSWTNERIGERP
jgi:hypothetical protein